ncbi:MAG: hypothetical protein U9R22_12165 [Pseudomonadota bacterium]|nr:hypothetical protein [Pseudomonadota bacterium]
MTQDRRTLLRMLGGGIAALGLTGAGRSLAASPTAPRPAPLKVEGTMPMLPPLARVMPAAPGLLDALAGEFAPTARQLATPKAYWIALNGWITDRLSGPIMDGKPLAHPLGEQTWALTATAYWGGMELRENWGMPPAMERLGIQMKAPFAALQQQLADKLTLRLKALEEGEDACLALLPSLMQDDTPDGAVWGMAYNAGAQVVKIEDAPVGQRRPHRAPNPAFVRINPRDFMRIDYELPSPHYLRAWRSAFERAVRANPDGYGTLITEKSGKETLRDLWGRAVLFANTTWGGGANDGWSTEYFDDVLHWSTVVTFGLEAIGLAAFVALLNRDGEAARRAVMGNALYVGMASGWLMGFLDTDNRLPALS